MSRYILHQLVDRIPEEELSAAQRFLEYLVVRPAHRAALSAPPDDVLREFGPSLSEVPW